jgi:hypothetical protein
MPSLGTIMWRGRSGREYKYDIYQIGTTLEAVPGNFIFAEETRPGTFLPVYIGQTGDLSRPLVQHDTMPCIRRNRVTFVHVRRNDEGDRARILEEADLIALWDPPCNQATRPRGVKTTGETSRRESDTVSSWKA